MGNCQAIDNASLVIQYPCGRIDKLYTPVTATHIMKTNPGLYVALLLTTNTNNNNNNSVRITRIKLLRPTDTLSLGHAYRLITTQEVMKGLRAKKYAKMKKKQTEEEADSDFDKLATRSDMGTRDQVKKHERHRPRTTSSLASNSVSNVKSSTAWQPSLQSISEAGS